MIDKIKAKEELKPIILRLKSRGRRIVFTNGCFDLIHFGHVQYLQEAKKKGDILIVAVNSDSSIKKIKGKNRPIVGEKYRLGVIAGLECVDYVVKFSEDTPLKLIKFLKPDVLVKGADWAKEKIVGKDIVELFGGRVATIKLTPGLSTTKIIEKIAQNF